VDWSFVVLCICLQPHFKILFRDVLKGKNEVKLKLVSIKKRILKLHKKIRLSILSLLCCEGSLKRSQVIPVNVDMKNQVHLAI